MTMNVLVIVKRLAAILLLMVVLKLQMYQQVAGQFIRMLVKPPGQLSPARVWRFKTMLPAIPTVAIN